MDLKVIEIFDNFCKKILEIHLDEDIQSTINTVLSLSEEDKHTLVTNFVDKFTNVKNGHELLQNKKTKLFSSKEEETFALSTSLFGEVVSLKRLFNNLEGDNRNYLWISLKVLIDYVRPKKVTNDILKLDVDENTNEMITDIVSEFKNNMGKDGNTNPLQAVFSVTNAITEKYQGKLESGEIKLDNLLNDLQEKMPGVKGMMENMGKMAGGAQAPRKDTVVMDENFSTKDVVCGDDKPPENNIDLTKLLPQIEGLMGGGSAGGLGDMMSMLGDLDNKDPEKAKEAKDKMDSFMKDNFNIDTANMEKPEDLLNDDTLQKLSKNKSDNKKNL